VTVHDLIDKTYPQSQTAESIALTEKHMKAIAVRADRIICVSENTRRDLHSFLNVPVEKTCVVYNGVDHKMFYPLSEEQRREAHSRLSSEGIDKPYVLYVGTIEPRKNLTGLLQSFASLKSKKAFHGQLVVVGMKGWMQENIGSVIDKLGLKRDVFFTGYVSDSQLRALYNMAELFVFPSLYEGFGFPILEAFCCGAPVVASGTSSCGEIAGKAALTVDPSDPVLMAEAMGRVLQDKALKNSLRQAGLKRAQEFSFATMARQTLAVYQQTANI
jgi:glycosyltransferase involved in cell wall biosynthesis